MGCLQAVEDADAAGVTPEEAAEKTQISRYAARVLLEACLALELVESDRERAATASHRRGV